MNWIKNHFCSLRSLGRFRDEAWDDLYTEHCAHERKLWNACSCTGELVCFVGLGVKLLRMATCDLKLRVTRLYDSPQQRHCNAKTQTTKYEHWQDDGSPHDPSSETQCPFHCLHVSYVSNTFSVSADDKVTKEGISKSLKVWLQFQYTVLKTLETLKLGAWRHGCAVVHFSVPGSCTIK